MKVILFLCLCVLLCWRFLVSINGLLYIIAILLFLSSLHFEAK